MLDENKFDIRGDELDYRNILYQHSPKLLRTLYGYKGLRINHVGARSPLSMSSGRQTNQ
jgi:hypothetical protein